MQLKDGERGGIVYSTLAGSSSKFYWDVIIPSYGLEDNAM